MMQFIEISFSLSLTVEQRLLVLSERQRANEAEVTKRCISVAYYVMSQWSKQRLFYMEKLPLDLPNPYQLLDPTFAPLRVLISPIDNAAFQDICAKFSIDEHSALAWGITLMEIFEETVVTHRIFTRGEKGPHNVLLKWI